MFDWFERKMFQGDRELRLLISKESAELSTHDKQLLFNSCVEIINLELSSYCNRRCDYCPVSTSSRKDSQILMEDALFHAIVSDLQLINYSKSISLNLYNEPLCNEKFITQLAALRERLPLAWLQFNSNGDYVDEAIMEQLAKSGLNALCITIHPPPNKEYNSEELLKRLVILLGQLNRKSSIVDAETALDAGNNCFSLSYMGIALKVQWPNWRKVGSSRGGEIKHLEENRPVRTAPCARPFREFTIYFDGTVTPCCEIFHDADNSQPLKVASLMDRSLFNVYADQMLSEFRKSLFLFGEKKGVCRYCPVADNSREDHAELRNEIFNRSEVAQ